MGACPHKLKRIDIKKTKVPLNHHICNLCNDNVIEDEIHFLLCCDFYSDFRRPLLAKAQLYNKDFQNMPSNDKFIFIKNFVNMYSNTPRL